MSRSRNIKPGFFKNEVLAQLPFWQRLLFIGLWTVADRAGRFEDRPLRIKMELFPADDVDINAGLQALHDSGFILRYLCNGMKYCQVIAWAKHQNPHCKEVESTIPSPCEHGTSTVPAPEIPTPAALIPDSLIPDSPIFDPLIPSPNLKQPLSKEASFVSEENARASEARGRPSYDTSVGLQIDWRKWCKAQRELQLKLSQGWGAELTDEQVFQEQCVLAGVTADVGRELANRALGAPA
jgi:hypothetical protein